MTSQNRLSSAFGNRRRKTNKSVSYKELTSNTASIKKVRRLRLETALTQALARKERLWFFGHCQRSKRISLSFLWKLRHFYENMLQQQDKLKIVESCRLWNFQRRRLYYTKVISMMGIFLTVLARYHGTKDNKPAIIGVNDHTLVIEWWLCAG